MALPKIEHPTFEILLPSSNRKVKFRPFLVKEEKILLMALQGEDSEEIVSAIRQVISNCIISEDVDVENIPTIDLEYLFVKIRSKSVNNIITLTYRDTEDDKRYDIEVNLDDVEVKFDPEHSKVIEVNDTIKFIMKYPEASIAKRLEGIENETELLFGILKGCMDVIVEGSNEHSVADASEEELDEFLQSLDVNTFKKVQVFFNTMPRLHYEASYTNSLGNKRNIVFNSLSDFFTLG
jgi:hypothetical protein